MRYRNLGKEQRTQYRNQRVLACLFALTSLLLVTWLRPAAAVAEPGQEAETDATPRWWEKLIPPTSASYENLNVNLHGFGGWAYADTDENSYLGGSGKHRFDNIDGGLVVSATAYERLKVHLQMSAHANPVSDKTVELDRAFAQWTFADWLKLRAGRSPHPIGIFSETIDIGTTRPLFDLPQAVYGPVAVTAESYDGAGITGGFHIEDWEFLYDVYGGASHVPYATGWGVLAMGNVDTVGSVREATNSNFVGGRLLISPPFLEGLTVGGAGYRSDLESVEGEEMPRYVYGAQLALVRDAFSIWGEYYFHRVKEYEIKSHHAYVMAALRPFRVLDAGELLERLELVGLWDYAKNSGIQGIPFPPQPSQLKRHNEWAVGLNFWFTPTFVLRTEYHHVDDNLFAHDGWTLLQDVLADTLDDETDLIKVGLQFSF